MSRSEIMPLKESGEHSYHRRAFSHDYYAPFIYHIIMKKASDCKAFGSVTGDARIAPGNSGCARINESDLGRIIAKSLIHLPYQFPIIKLHQFCVMPDHIHILLQILFRSDKHLDFYIDSLRERIATKYSEAAGSTVKDEEIFAQGYCDKPLYDDRSLDSLFRYIRENPHRLAMRMQFPEFFQRVRRLTIGDAEYEAYGNLFLLRNPDKTTVKISRKYSEEEKQKRKAFWIESASRGTVIVSPFISPAEKVIRTEVESLGAKIILITHEAFPERFKPAKHDFSLCSDGRLLIISIGMPAQTPLSRDICLTMNALAAQISNCQR